MMNKKLLLTLLLVACFLSCLTQNTLAEETVQVKELEIKSREYELCLKKAEAQEKSGHAKEVLDTLYLCITQSDGIHRAFLHLISSSVVLRNELYNDGISFSTKLIKVYPNGSGFPDWYSLFENRALYYEAIGQYEKAIIDINKAITLKPDKSAMYAHRGRLFQHLKQYVPAERDFYQACNMAKYEAKNESANEWIINLTLSIGCSDDMEYKKAKNRGFNWVEFSRSSKQMYFYDKSKIKSANKGISRTWVRIEPAENSPDFNEEYKPTGQHTLLQWESNCSNETNRITSDIEYNEDSSVKSSWNDEKAVFNAVVPDSIGSALYDLVCKQPEKKKVNKAGKKR